MEIPININVKDRNYGTRLPIYNASIEIFNDFLNSRKFSEDEMRSLMDIAIDIDTKHSADKLKIVLNIWVKIFKGFPHNEDCYKWLLVSKRLISEKKISISRDIQIFIAKKLIYYTHDELDYLLAEDHMNIDLAKILLDFGAIPNEESIMAAVNDGDTNRLKLYLDNGYNIKGISNGDWKNIASNENSKFAHFLIENGADMTNIGEQELQDMIDAEKIELREIERRSRLRIGTISLILKGKKRLRPDTDT